MVQMGSVAGAKLMFGGPRTVDARERTIAIAAVLLLHGAAVGGLVLAQMHKSVDPPEAVLTVSFISEAAATSAASPAQPAAPPPPPPEPALLATPRPTLSPMTAPPAVEREIVRQVQPQSTTPAPAAAPAPPAPSVAQAAAPGPAAAEPTEAFTPPNFSAAYLNNPGAVYPVASRRRREQGIVRLKVQVGADGSVGQVQLDRTSGYPDLDNAAMDVVKKRWRFAPAKQGDRPVSAWVIVPMEFSFKDR